MSLENAEGGPGGGLLMVGPGEILTNFLTGGEPDSLLRGVDRRRRYGLRRWSRTSYAPPMICLYISF